MPVKVEKKDAAGERHVVVGCCVSKIVLGAVAAKWEPNLFPSRWSNVIVGWCVAHYRKYARAPGRDVAGYFDEWAFKNAHEADTVAAVERLLVSLSDEYERLKKTTSPDYLIDVAARVANAHRVAQLKYAIEADLESGESEKAMARIDAFRKLDIGTGSGIDVLSDDAAWDAMFDNADAPPLIEYPDAAGAFFNWAMTRGRFIAFLAKDKGKKSFFLQDAAWRAVEQGRKVAYFEIGDMTQPQVLERFAPRIAGRPLLAGKYEFPVELEAGDEEKKPHYRSECREEEYPLTAAVLKKERDRWRAKVGDSWKLSCHPAGTLSVSGADAILDGWERDGFVPDVVLFDYADLFAPEDARAEKREQINDTWLAMRGMSQKRHVLLLTATQADADSYKARLLGRDNFSGSKVKNAHVDGIAGLNQNDHEEARGVFRVNWVVGRKWAHGSKRVLTVASCLALSDTVVMSTF